jgi:hypothetical protein
VRECWTCRRKIDLTLPKLIYRSIVLFSHKMLFHRRFGPLVTNIIPEASTLATMATLSSYNVVVDAEED